MPMKHDRDGERRESQRVVFDAGGGEAEGFEQSEEALRRQAENMEDGRNPRYDASRPEKGRPSATYGEADEEHSAELHDDDR